MRGEVRKEQREREKGKRDKKVMMVAGCNSLKEIEGYLVRPSAIEL